MSKNNFAAFIFGCLVGSAATYVYLNRKKYEETQDFDDEQEPTQEEKNMYMKNYKTHLRHYRCDNVEKGDENEMIKPYVISPEEFGENDDYEQISMTYYSDEVLADDNDNIVNDIEDVIGEDSLTHFGEYEDDSVFVRNDILKCDYEILLDSRKYSDVLNEIPNINR